MTAKYATNKRWRHKRTPHVLGIRQAEKRRYRRRTGSFLYRRPWTPAEDALILLRPKPDRELALELRRSVQAIQVRRSRIKNL